MQHLALVCTFTAIAPETVAVHVAFGFDTKPVHPMAVWHRRRSRAAAKGQPEGQRGRGEEDGREAGAEQAL